MKSTVFSRGVVSMAALAIVWQTAGRCMSQEQGQAIDWKATFHRAQACHGQTSSFGDSLIKTLADEKASNIDRMFAARCLGELRYLAAIPLLIEHIDLNPDGRDLSQPVANALRPFGSAAVPAVVEAYLAHKNDVASPALRREAGYLTVLGAKGNVQTARWLMKGIAVETDDEDKKERIDQFLQMKFDE